MTDNRMIHKQTFTKNKIIYSYWTEGDRKNPPLVLIPGFTGTHGDLLEFARQFKEKYFVVIPDFPGWGESPKGKYHLTIEGYAKFIDDVLQSLGITKIFLAGHCMGSVVAIEFAYKYSAKVKELFLIGVPYLEGSLGDEMFRHLAHVSRKAPQFLRPFFFFFRSRIIAIPLGFFVVKTRSWKKKFSIILHNTIKQQFQDEDLVEKNWNSLVLFDYKKLQSIKIPIHIFHGEKDLLVPSEQAKKIMEFCPAATFDIISQAGHMPPIETPETLAGMMKKYL